MNDIKVQSASDHQDTVFSEVRIGCVTSPKNEQAPFQLSNPNPELSESAYTVFAASCDSEILYRVGIAMQTLVGSEHQSWLCLASAACPEVLQNNLQGGVTGSCSISSAENRVGSGSA